jgi:DNA invertase Pin-like site-specific DNA recombinase
MAVRSLPVAPQPWGLCVRISYARDGSTLGVERQEPPTKALIERLGGYVYRVYVRNDTSAFNSQVFPFEDALDDLRAGHIVGLAAWQLDRFTRRVDHATYLQKEVMALGGRVAWGGAEVDVTRAAGRFNVNVLSAVSQFESDLRSERITLKRDQEAKAGRPHSGGTRPFGFKTDRVAHDPDEAKLIQEAADRLLQGESSYSILADWHERTPPVLTPTGGRWTTTTFRRMLTSPRMIGRRRHLDTVYDAEWEPILDRLVWERLVHDVFGGKKPGYHGRSLVYPLIGLVFCGKCGAALVSRQDGRRERCYGCPPARWRGNGCGKTSIVAGKTEEFVRDIALELLETPAVWKAIMAATSDDSRVDTLIQERDQLTRRRNELEDRRDDPTIPLARTDRSLAKLDARLVEIDQELARRAPRRRPLAVPAGRTPEWVWDQGNADLRRNLLRLVIDRVTIGPATPPYRWNPDRVDILLVEKLQSDATVAAIVSQVLRARS